MCAKGGRKNKKTPSQARNSIKRCKRRSDSRTEKRIISTSEVKGKQKPTRRPITGWRLWLFRIVALTVIPALLFLLLELGLRIVGYGFPSTATIKCEVNGKEFYCDNVKFGWRFFPRNLARESDPFIFPAEKSQGTYRIFVLGASAAQGAPDAAFCFGRLLRVMLQDAYPAAEFEVIVATMTAINSHVVLEIAKDNIRHQADMFVIYMGNNEVVGPYGPGTVFSRFSSSLPLIRAGIALKATRLGQLLTNLFDVASTGTNKPVSWRGLEMFLEKQVKANDSRLENIYQHFRRNLEDITRIALKGGAKTILCTVGSNLKDCPPFASLHRQDLSDAEMKKWDNIYQQGVAHETAEKYGEAAARYLAAAEIDDCYADLQFRMGRCYWAMGEYERARDEYIKARELDTLRFRADSRINEIIRAVASDKAANDVYLVDAVKAFEKNSPHQVTGKELFYEHVHLNFRGNYLLAKTIFEQVEKLLPEVVKSHKAGKRSFITEEECARRLVYSDWSRYRIADNVLNSYIKRAPFTNQLYHKEHVKEMEKQLQALEANMTAEVLRKEVSKYSRAIQNDREDWWLRWRYVELLLVGLKDYQTAVKQCRWVVDYLPSFRAGHAKLAMLLCELGHTDESIAYHLKALQIYPTSYTHYRIGLLYQRQSRLDKAVEHYFKALRLQPNHVGTNINLGTVLYQQGKLDKAVETYRKGLHFVPNSVDMHYNLAFLLEKQGRKDEAIKELRTALQIDPNSVEIRRVLETILKKRS
jgi:tetratricopeptide (TPR) repeat protein